MTSQPPPSQMGFAQRLAHPRKAWRRAISGAMVVLVLAACTSVQTTAPGTVGVDRKQRFSTLISEAQLEQGSRQAYSKIIGESETAKTLNPDPKQVKRVRAIAQRLIAVMGVFRKDAADWDWEVNVIESDQINAWAMPGGKMAVYSGIIEKLELTDDELAAIMGHEIAHALREHGRERASTAAGQGIFARVVGVATGLQLGEQLANMALQVAVGLPNSRTQESEADRIGVELAARAGFDPAAAVTLWQKMAKAAGGQGQPAFLSTHPSPVQRIDELKLVVEQVRPLTQK